MVKEPNGHAEAEEGQGQGRELSPQEMAAERAVSAPDDTEFDAGEGGPKYNERAGRYVDPATGRFAKRPETAEETPPPVQTNPRERIAEAFAKARKAAHEEEGNEAPIPLPKQLRTGMTDEEVNEQAGIKPRGQEPGEGDELSGQEPGEGGQEPPAQGQDQPPGSKAPVPLLITVDGQVYHVDRNDPRWSAPGMTDDMVRANAQMFWATQARLATANQLLDTARGKMPPAPADQSGSQGQPPAPQGTGASGETKPVIDREKLGEIADRVQLGNRDELVEALEELVSGLVQAVGQRQPEVDIHGQVEQAFVQHQNQNEIDRAITEFETKNSDIAGNKYLSQTVLDMAVDLMVEDMKKLGVTDEMLQPVLGKGRMIAGMYRNMKAQGWPLQTHGEVLGKAADRLRQTFNLPRSRQPNEADTAAAQQRLAAKRQMQQQPRSAGVKNPQGQPPRPMTRAEIVQAEKARRMPWLS